MAHVLGSRKSLPSLCGGGRPRVACPAARRDVLVATTASLVGSMAQPVDGAAVYDSHATTMQRVQLGGNAESSPALLPDYTVQGPLSVQKLPKLEHTCIRCFPACQINKCLLRVDVWYPKGGLSIGQAPPYPLAIFSSGFLVSSDNYQSYARRLTSWGYTVMLYDKMETAVDPVDDELSAAFITELIDWAGADPILKQVADPRRVYLLGHSRGAKVATLAAAQDTRVAALCLVDPVDNTVYAPLGPGFPSAAAALQNVPQTRSLPVAIVGGGIGGDCAPAGSNHETFYSAAPGVAWEVLISDCGHFQFLDKQSMVQQAICGQGQAPDEAVRSITQGVMVAWGELATKSSSWSAPDGATHAGDSATAAPNINLPFQHEASEASEPSLPPILHSSSFSSLSTDRFSNHSGRVPSLPQTPPEGGRGVSSCSDQSGNNEFMYQRSSTSSDDVNSRTLYGEAEKLERAGYGSMAGAGWMSKSSVQREKYRSDSRGGFAACSVRGVGLAAQWPEVAQRVSERAEEILNRAGSGSTGRPLEILYRLKQG